MDVFNCFFISELQMKTFLKTKVQECVITNTCDNNQVQNNSIVACPELPCCLSRKQH